MSKDIVPIGKIISGDAARDAVHVAIAPVTAGDDLSPGEHIGRLDDGTFGESAVTLGIVDPFLKERVKKGQKFYLWLYPNTITSLRHVWTHPAFTFTPGSKQ